MGVFNFIVDMSQEGRLSDHEERIEELEKKIELMSLWIGQLHEQLKEKHDDSSTGL
jgi:hypothetical protein